MNFRNNNLYRVAAYERLSREDDRRDESSSIESQKMIIESFAKFQNFNILKHYSDDGYTGSNFNRPDFELLKRDIEDGLINCVIVKDLSRLGRELYETGTYIEEYFIKKNVRFIAINDGYDSEVGDSMLGIRLSVNDLYLRDTSKKIRSSFDAKRKRGDYIGSFAKFGYKKDPNNSKKLILDEYAAPIVHDMFEWAANGNGTSIIAHRLTERGIPIPSIYKKENRPNRQKKLNQGKGIWRPQTVKDIINDEMYLGHMVQGRWKKISYNSKKLIETPRSEWIIVKNTHEPIVSEELFNKVQIEMHKNDKCIAKGKDKRLFQGLMKCKECGHTIGINNRKLKSGISSFTVCNNYAKYSKYHICTEHRLNYNYLEEDLLCFLRKVGKNFLNDCNQEKLIKDSMDIKNKEINLFQKKLECTKREIEKVQSIISNLYEDRLNEIISIRQYSMMSKKYDDKLIELEEQEKILNYKIANSSTKVNQEAYFSCKKLLTEFMEFKYPTRELIQQLIEKIEIDKDNNIEVFFKIDISKYVSIDEK